jgi:hypothetical protein
MGKVKSLVMDGVFCPGCGERIGEAVGHTRYCSSCAPYRNMIGAGPSG